MAFKYGYKIEKGAYTGDILPLTSNFPNKAGSYSYNYFGTFQDDTIVSDDHVVSEYFDPNTSLMLEITPQLYAHGVVGDEVKIASIPLYAGQGSSETKTGYITLYLECFSQLREWYVKVCVEDLNGNNPSGIVSSTVLSINDASGDWASNHETHAYLALTGYESGGVKMIGMYINSAQWLLEPGMFTGKYRCHWLATGTVIKLNTILATFGIDADGNGDPVAFDPELGEGSEPEGYDMEDTGPGSYDDSSDSISNVPDPSYGILDAGFVNVYKVSTGALTALGNDVFPQLSSVTDLVSGLQCVSDMLFNSRLIDYVLDVHIIPCNVPAGSPTAVKVGGRTCSAQGDPVTANYVNVDLGTINIKEYFKNFADFCYTSSKLHLPFVGFVDMKPEFWNGGALNVKYKFNVADGSFMAYVYATSSKSELKSSLVAEYSGQAAIHIPVTGASYASAISGLLASAGQTIASATTGNVAGVAQGVISAAANTSPDINQSNGYNSSASIMGSKKAYLQIERPAYSMSVFSQKEQGFPLNVTYKIGQMQGFTKADDLILDGIPCTEAEKEKIRNFFRSGVIIRNLS